MNMQIYEEASDWLIKNRSGDLDARDKKHFDRWLRLSPQHVQAYLEMSSVWEDTGSLDSNGNMAADELIERARDEDVVVPLAASASQATFQAAAARGRGFPLPRKAGLALAASILIAVAGGWLYSQRNIYSAAVGEQRAIALEDGSTMELNSRSRVRIRYSSTERSIELLEGQALFKVAKDTARPFVVRSDSTVVRALGTQFDVYQKHNGTVVTVIEGRVAVANLSTAAPEVHVEKAAIVLDAGEQLTVTPTRLIASKHANVAAATAWTQRNLVFNSTPLTEIAEEFNRYNIRQFVIEDPQLANFHVSGVFSSVDPVLLLRFLRTQPKLVIEETDREIRVSQR